MTNSKGKSRRRWTSSAIVAAVVSSLFACAATRQATAITKPQSPAEGAGDYEGAVQPLERPIVPTSDPGVDDERTKRCPPLCDDDGKWSGCGLVERKDNGSSCKGCAAKCRTPGSSGEGWYDCNGILIAARTCG
ncbi:MAG: hypothetical protein ACHREM_14730 [Polyangiales bacterium]